MLGKIALAALVLVAPTGMAAAQVVDPAPAGSNGLDIPRDVQFVGQAGPAIRNPTTIVNGEVLTEGDVDERLALVIASINYRLEPHDVERGRAEILRTLIDETLWIQDAAAHEIGVEVRDVDSLYQRVADNGHRTLDQFSAYLRSIGSSERSLKRQLRGALARQRILSRQIAPSADVGDQALALIASLNASLTTTEYDLAEIVRHQSDRETSAEFLALAAEIVRQLRAGASFSDWVARASASESRARGGRIGYLRLDEMPPQVAALIPRLADGGYSDPMPYLGPGGGFVIYRLQETRQVFVGHPLVSLIQMSLAIPASATEAQEQAAARLLSQTTGGCGSTAAAARTIGAELAAIDRVNVQDLPPVLRQAMFNLSVGMATQPFRSPERISVLVLCGREDALAVSAPDANETPQSIDAQRVNLRAQRYLRDLRRDAVIEPGAEW